MAQRHNSVRSYTLCEFAQEQEVNHREILHEHLKEEKLHAKKMKVPKGVWGLGCGYLTMCQDKSGKPSRSLDYLICLLPLACRDSRTL